MAITINLTVHPVYEQMPNVDTDVLIFDRESPIGQLGAYAGDDDDGPMWVDSHGMPVGDVTHWAELPRLDATT